jgi:23S rRNA pseudouridine2605 synthase
LEIRLQKFLAEAGVASRRASERLIIQGRVKVNNKVVHKLGTKIDPQKDKVEVDDKVCNAIPKDLYILLNKPVGVVTTVKDPHGRPTVIDLIKGIDQRVYPVGRLDMDSEGLLILTNDGRVTYKITHPKYEIEKTYEVLVKGIVDNKKIKTLETGVKLTDGITSPAKVKILKTNKNSTLLQIIIHEGKNRQVRRMCEAVGHPVLLLKRTHIGKLSLKGIKSGKWRHMTDEEIKYIKSL